MVVQIFDNIILSSSLTISRREYQFQLGIMLVLKEFKETLLDIGLGNPNNN
ncbi:hypothetical protein PIROE2DRAFT_17955 [Piromyces sp. E2]|nr:hypothetical protein PIROE2DRAFT_17955 [Piromyces sp. E2]|eukprot:OUM57144.1 hypothetical protein PIROE2DRAFT_17955 [Piromyces sp. E2]